MPTTGHRFPSPLLYMPSPLSDLPLEASAMAWGYLVLIWGCRSHRPQTKIASLETNGRDTGRGGVREIETDKSFWLPSALSLVHCFPSSTTDTFMSASSKAALNFSGSACGGGETRQPCPPTWPPRTRNSSTVIIHAPWAEVSDTFTG